MNYLNTLATKATAGLFRSSWGSALGTPNSRHSSVRGTNDEQPEPTHPSADNNDPAIKLYLGEIARIPLLTPQEEIDLAAQVKNGDAEARLHLINSNLGLVVTIAREYAKLGLPLLDLVLEGKIGLMTAVDRFDPAKGGEFSSYAAWWIRQAIKARDLQLENAIAF